MKTYGFHPFVRTFVNEKKGMIYDLLDGSAYQVDSKVIELFRSKTYQYLVTIEDKAAKFGMRPNDVKRILEEGKRTGLIIDLNDAAWRSEVLADQWGMYDRFYVDKCRKCSMVPICSGEGCPYDILIKNKGNIVCNCQERHDNYLTYLKMVYQDKQTKAKV